MNTKEKWISETMESLNTIHGAKANPMLYENVMREIKKGSAKIIILTPTTLLKVAACAALLVGLNVFSILHYHTSHRTEKNTTNPIVSEYFNYSNSI